MSDCVLEGEDFLERVEVSVSGAVGFVREEDGTAVFREVLLGLRVVVQLPEISDSSGHVDVLRIAARLLVTLVRSDELEVFAVTLAVFLLLLVLI